MRVAEVENWILQIADAAKAGQQVESSRVELKREWPKPDHRTSRQLGGMCNAALDEHVLWVIGIDEKDRQIVGAPNVDIPAWFSTVRKHFAGVTPDLALHLG